MIVLDALPVDIRDSARGVLWNREVRDGKPTKVPYQAHHPALRAAVDDPDTWAPFPDVIAAYEDGKGDGAGIVLGEGLVGVDLDGCRDPVTGTITTEAQHIIETLNSYTEASPSGTGIHILLRGALPAGGRRKGKTEMYAEGRYFTVTGCHMDGTPRTIERRGAELAAVHAELFGRNGNNGQRPAARPLAPVSTDDAALLERAHSARNGATFAALWAGDTSQHGGDDSAADLALCNLLAFWTGADAGRIDRLFRQSGLMRQKWDSRRGQQTYGDRTIETAIAGCRETYTDPHSPITVPKAAPDPEPEPVTSESAPFTIATPPDSFVSRYIAHVAARTDAPLHAHEAMALGVLSALAGPGPHIPMATSPKGRRLVLWVSYIVNSTEGRKTTVIQFARDLIEAVLGSDAIIEWEGSPQGLIQRLQARDHQAAVFIRDEYSGLLQQMNRGGHMAGLEQTFIRSFDGGVLENIRTRKRHKTTGELHTDTDRVENPYLVKLTATTWDCVHAARHDRQRPRWIPRTVYLRAWECNSASRMQNDWRAARRLGRSGHASPDVSRARQTDDDPRRR